MVSHGERAELRNCRVESLQRLSQSNPSQRAGDTRYIREKCKKSIIKSLSNSFTSHDEIL